MRYALTGATGFVGGALATTARRRARGGRARPRPAPAPSGLARLGVRAGLADDLDDATALDRPCAGTRTGSSTSPAGTSSASATRRPATRVNVDGTRNVLGRGAAGGRREGRLHQHAGGQLRHRRPGASTRPTGFTGPFTCPTTTSPRREAHDIAWSRSRPRASTGRDRAARASSTAPATPPRPARSSSRSCAAERPPRRPHGGERLLGARRRRRRRRTCSRWSAAAPGESYMLAGPPGHASPTGPAHASRGVAGTPGPARAARPGWSRSSARRHGRPSARSCRCRRTTPPRRCSAGLATYYGAPAKAERRAGLARRDPSRRVCDRPWSTSAVADEAVLHRVSRRRGSSSP